jgi:hypothetical protein
MVTPSSAAVAAVVTGRGTSGAKVHKEKVTKVVMVDQSAAAAADAAAAGAEFDAARAAMGKLKAKSVAEVCQLKQPPPAVRQLLHAACAAMGKQARCGW